MVITGATCSVGERRALYAIDFQLRSSPDCQKASLHASRITFRPSNLCYCIEMQVAQVFMRVNISNGIYLY